MALQYLTPALVGKLAASLGINSTVAQTIIKAAVPVILGSLAGKASQPDGARSLFDVLAKQDTGLLGRLGSVLGSPQQKTIAEQGSNVLGSLLGQSSLGTLINAVAKYSNINSTAAGGVIGMLAPIVLGTLGQQQKSSRLDASGIAKLLGDQQTNIASAIPSDLSRLLAGSGLLDAVLPKAEAAAAPASRTPASPTPASPTPTSPTPAQPAKPFNGWPWAALVAAASVLWGTWFGGDPAPWSNVPVPPRLMAGSTDVAGEMDVALKSLHGLLSTVKDKASAEAALPQLKLAQTTFERLDGAAKQLPSDGKRMLAGYIASWLPVITPVMTSLLANTNAAPLVKPIIDAVKGRLEALANG
jgi:hypothetical protein